MSFECKEDEDHVWRYSDRERTCAYCNLEEVVIGAWQRKDPAKVRMIDKMKKHNLDDVYAALNEMDFSVLFDALRVAGNCQAGLKNQKGLDSLVNVIGTVFKLEEFKDQQLAMETKPSS